MKGTSLVYELRLIAFIDILGFKEIIKKSQTDPSKIKLIYDVLEYLKDWEESEKWDLKFIEIEESAEYRGLGNFDIRGKTNVTSFSDCIVVSVKVEENINEMASTLIVNLAHIGSVLLEEGILFRGGLTIGDIVHTDRGTVFGQGLIDAFMLETRIAKYPRIILSDKLLSKLHYPIETKRNKYPYHQYLYRFDDGCVGFNQLIHYEVTETWTERTIKSFSESLSKVRKVITSGLDLSFEKPEVFEKFKWLKEEYNKLIGQTGFDIDTNPEEHIKHKIRELDEGMTGFNIHYLYTNNAYENRNKGK
jgi:hypothetical protein